MSSMTSWPGRAFTLAVLISIAVPAASDSPAGHPPGHPATPPAASKLRPDEPLPGMPPVTDAKDIYSATRAGLLSPSVKDITPRIYVPNSVTDTVDVIDPVTYKIVNHFPVGHQPQHVTPSYDMKTLWVLNDLGDTLTAIDPATGQKGKTIPVMDPYNMYYTPDGRFAIVVAERLARLDFRDAHTFKLVRSLPVPCVGVDHMDFSGDGTFLIASCEFSGRHLRRRREVVPGDGVRADRPGRARPVRESRLEVDVRDQPRRRQRVAVRLRDRAGGRDVADSRRFPRHGGPVGRRSVPVAQRAVRRPGIRDRHDERCGGASHRGRQRATRLVRVPPARAVLARTHRRLPLIGGAAALRSRPAATLSPRRPVRRGPGTGAGRWGPPSA
jgi:hypothetical protein